MNEYLSDRLFHFVGNRRPEDHEANFQTLCSILKSGRVRSGAGDSGNADIRIEVAPDFSLFDEKLANPAITCYCDIPEAALAIHSAKYGRFGVGFDRLFLARLGARPVYYFPMTAHDWGSPYGASLIKDIEAKFRGFLDHLHLPLPARTHRSRSVGSRPESRDETIQDIYTLLIKDFLSFVKPYDAELQHHDPRYYYAEREWRHLGGLSFRAIDVAAIVVADGYRDRLLAALPDYRGRISEFGELQQHSSSSA